MSQVRIKFTWENRSHYINIDEMNIYDYMRENGIDHETAEDFAAWSYLAGDSEEYENDDFTGIIYE